MEIVRLLPFRKILHTAFFILLVPLFLHAQEFSGTNHAAWYRPKAAVHSSVQVWSKNKDTLQVLSSVRLQNGRDIDSYQFLLHFKKDLEGSGIMVPVPVNFSKKEEGHFLAQTNVPVRDSLYYIILEVLDPEQPGTSYWSVATLDPEFTYPPPSFYLRQMPDSIPLFKNYIRSGENLIIQGNFPSYTAFFYDEEFSAADPPVAASKDNNATLEVTDKKWISADSVFSPDREGLFFIQHDTTALRGQSFRAESPYYPEVGTLQEFAGPIRYLSTTEEWNKLAKSDFSKKEIDRFWLKIAQTQDRAKRIIKSYYEQVALANHYFTSYKEGWKTDQGMIYILYGPPDIVTVEKEREIWIYLKSAELPEIKFTFVRVKNPFTDRHFVLLRSKNYIKTHYQVVSQWRRGKRTL